MTTFAYIAIAALVAISLALLLALLLVIFLLRRSRSDIGSWTPEHIGYVLLGIVARAEQKALHKTESGATPDRKWLLDTFAECMQAVKDPNKRLGA
jgi:hypothetical protein